MAKISAPLEPSDSFPIFLDLLELNKKKMRLYAPVKLGKDDEEEQDILATAGDHTYQLEYRPVSSVSRRYKIDSARLDMTEEQAVVYFNAIKSVELAKIRGELSWIKWLMVIAMLGGTVVYF